MADILKPCEIPRSRGGKNLRHRFLILGRYIPAVIEKVTAHILSVTLTSLLRPLVILRRMVHDKIHADINALLMAGCRQGVKIFHGSQLFLHFPEICHRVPAVGASLWRIQKRHQMNIVHVTLLNIIKLRLHTFHIAGKIVDIKHHAQHVVLLIPFFVFFPVCIQLFQFVISFHIELIHLVTQFRKHGIILI